MMTPSRKVLCGGVYFFTLIILCHMLNIIIKSQHELFKINGKIKNRKGFY